MHDKHGLDAKMPPVPPNTVENKVVETRAGVKGSAHEAELDEEMEEEDDHENENEDEEMTEE